MKEIWIKIKLRIQSLRFMAFAVLFWQLLVVMAPPLCRWSSLCNATTETVATTGSASDNRKQHWLQPGFWRHQLARTSSYNQQLQLNKAQTPTIVPLQLWNLLKRDTCYREKCGHGGETAGNTTRFPDSMADNQGTKVVYILRRVFPHFWLWCYEPWQVVALAEHGKRVQLQPPLTCKNPLNRLRLKWTEAITSGRKQLKWNC